MLNSRVLSLFLIAAAAIAVLVVLVLMTDRAHFLSIATKVEMHTMDEEGSQSHLHYMNTTMIHAKAGNRTTESLVLESGGGGSVVKMDQPEPMVLSENYWEQTGNAINSLMNLQCWARTNNIGKVVEPAIVPHSYSAFQLPKNDKSLKFSDLFDIELWNSMSVKHNYSTLVSVKYFLQHAVKKVVYVHIKYEWSPVRCRKKTSFFPKDGFRVVKSVCIDFVHSHTMSEGKFRDLIFEGIDYDVTVLFNQWRGIRDAGRIALKGKKCRNCLSMASVITTGESSPAITYVPLNARSAIVPSKPIENYIHQFLSEHLSGDQYLAIMLRTEKIKITNSCEKGIIADWKAMVEANNITKTLFFSDVGKHGSMGWGNSNSAAARFSQHIHDAVHVYLSLDKVNSILEHYPGSQNSVQIAALHQQLVAHARCVVMVGGGTFQAHTLTQYVHRHRGHQCYSIRTGECESRYISTVYGQED